MEIGAPDWIRTSDPCLRRAAKKMNYVNKIGVFFLEIKPLTEG
jgi:hypothetical protein